MRKNSLRQKNGRHKEDTVLWRQWIPESVKGFGDERNGTILTMLE